MHDNQFSCHLFGLLLGLGSGLVLGVVHLHGCAESLNVCKM